MHLDNTELLFIEYLKARKEISFTGCVSFFNDRGIYGYNIIERMLKSISHKSPVNIEVVRASMMRDGGLFIPPQIIVTYNPYIFR